MNRPIQIRNEQVVSDIRELAALQHKPITDAVAEAVHEKLERLKRDDDAREREIDRILAEIDALPIVGPMLTDDDLYDEDGLPK